MTWTLTVVPIEGLKQIWSLVAPLLAPAVQQSGGRIDMRSVFEWLSTERSTLWVAYGSDKIVRVAFTTRVTRYPRKTMLVIECCGGSMMTEWIEEASRTFRRYARDLKLDGVEAYGRSGWTRALRPYGWTQTLVLSEVHVAESDDA